MMAGVSVIPDVQLVKTVAVEAANAAQVVAVPVEEVFKKATEKLEADISKIETKIPRFPASLRGFSEDGGYIVPSMVAIGPYHHGSPHLRETEEVKRAAAYYFCGESGDLLEEMYEKVLSVARDARRCYADSAVAGMGDADFAAMMFRDGCFLLQFMVWCVDNDEVAPSLRSWFESNQASLARDIFLLENQMPWLVLDALMTFRSVPVREYIAAAGSSFEIRVDLSKEPITFDFEGSGYTPPHLLGLLRLYELGIMAGEKLTDPPAEIVSGAQSSSAVELAEIGIKLTASKTTKFKDMGIINNGPLCSKLFLPPLVMDDLNACYLVNMVVLETCTAPGSGDEHTVSSYIHLLAMLMNREEDVHELRVKRLVHGKFSDQQTLDFFNNLVNLLIIPDHYGNILAELEAYKRKRRMWIPMHRFVYNNRKTIITVLSAIGVLVGIFKALLSLKQH